MVDVDQSSESIRLYEELELTCVREWLTVERVSKERLGRNREA
jgi:hypothetical protein